MWIHFFPVNILLYILCGIILWVHQITCFIIVWIDCGSASACFGFPFEYETSDLCLCRRTPCREQHVTLPTPSKNESVPNCVWMPEWHASIIPKRNASKHNRNWQLQGISERKTHLKGIPWHFDSCYSFLLYENTIFQCAVLLSVFDKCYYSS